MSGKYGKKAVVSWTVSDDDAHCGDIDDRSVRAFAVKPAPSARRQAALGLTARRGRANPATVPLMHSLRCSGLTGLSDNVRQVECWFSQIMLGKLSIIGTVAVILMIPTAPCAQMGGAVNPGVHVGGAVSPGASVRGAVDRGIPGPRSRDLALAE